MQNILQKQSKGVPGMPSPQNKTQRRSKLSVLWASLVALALILPTLAIGATVVIFQAFQLNLPGVTLMDKDVGLMTRQQTEDWAEYIWNQSHQITLANPEDPSITYLLSPQELGFWVDAAATADTVFAFGRGNRPLADIQTLLRKDEVTLLPVLYFDPDAARKTLSDLSEDLTIPPVNAKVVYQEGAWTTLPGTTGVTVDIESTIQTLFDNAYTIFLSGQAAFFMKPVPPEIQDLSPVLQEIDAAAARELRLEAYDPILDETLVWTVPEDVKKSWIHVDPETFAVTLDLDKEAIAAFLSNWQQDLGTTRSLAVPPDLEEMIRNWEHGELMETTIVHNPTTYSVRSGDSLWSISLDLGIPMWYILEANEGLTTDNLESGMTLTIPSKNILLPLPVIRGKRIQIDISEQRMYVYEAGALIATHIISTGVEDSPTMAGVFQVQTHETNAYASNWDLYMPHFMGIYEAWPGFMNGIHGLPLLSSGQRLWAGNLGSPVSYGCIILGLEEAETLYQWAENGVVVEIVP